VRIYVCTPGELRIAQIAGFKPSEIVITGCNFSGSETKDIVASGATLIANSIQQLVAFAKHKGVKKLGLRLALSMTVPSGTINPSVGVDSRVGLLEKEIEHAMAVAEKKRLSINGIHSYLGTNILQYTYFVEAMDRLLYFAEQLKDIEYIDIGGGFGVQSRPDEEMFNWQKFGSAINDRMARLCGFLNRNIELKLEPGRSIIGNAGILLSRVTEVTRRNGRTYVGTDTSMSNFARPYVYGQKHEVLLAEDFKERPVEEIVFIGGNTVASGDFLAKNISLPRIEKGDLIAIMCTGAYGFSMSSHFCCRLRPAEVMVKGNDVRLVRERETTESLVREQLFGNVERVRPSKVFVGVSLKTPGPL
jgi:diaminopimelate decarboxylase